MRTDALCNAEVKTFEQRGLDGLREGSAARSSAVADGAAMAVAAARPPKRPGRLRPDGASVGRQAAFRASAATLRREAGGSPVPAAVQADGVQVPQAPPPSGPSPIPRRSRHLKKLRRLAKRGDIELWKSGRMPFPAARHALPNVDFHPKTGIPWSNMPPRASPSPVSARSACEAASSFTSCRPSSTRSHSKPT